MATIVLSAAGFAAGASLGGTVLGLSSAVIGRAIGATLGRVIDQRLMGRGSEAVETARVDRFRLTGASEGAAVSQLYGRMRIPGQVIWATRFSETSTTSGGGKGGGASKPKTTSYSYSVSLAIALCEGQITRVGRVWADGVEVAMDDLNMRTYQGDDAQLPDPKIEAVEGAQNAPSYRGTAYVVLEDLPLAQFGNRVPQFTFEVLRGTAADAPEFDLAKTIRAVALMPGTGEYALATTPVYYSGGFGRNRSANINSPSGKTDFATSLQALTEELPQCGSASLIVSWFGNDLRCGECNLKPKVEQKLEDGQGMPWVVSGTARAAADEIAKVDGRSVYGGTPADASVIEAIQSLNDNGQKPVFYPFILMEQLEGNGLPDPWSAAPNQPVLPWRGRITVSKAPGQYSTPDQTATADTQVAQFFGQAAVADFTANGTTVTYSGPAEWSYRRFILHYAHLCALAGGVDAFCIGSEMRSLTQIRGANGFPAVEALRALAADVRSILGAGTKISYASDWSEYFGYHPQDGSGDVLFHLDPLWADPNIDFIGIDNYMPLSDWREGHDHKDAHWGSIYRADYLQSHIEGGEGYDWYYHSPEAEAAQIRTPIVDAQHSEPWVYRYKDIRGWWENPHHNRIGGVRQPVGTAWVPQSKPIWFTELGCAAVDKGTNQPNKFLDPKSSESSLPRYSDGRRDELIQFQYLNAMHSYWADQARNPLSTQYAGAMIDTSRAHVWAWDMRPYPFFPANTAVWSDGENYSRGHWLNGRTSGRSLASVVAEICRKSGVHSFDVSGLFGYLRGYVVADVTDARAALQPLMLTYGFEAIERDGTLIFKNRSGRSDAEIKPADLALSEDLSSDLEHHRVPEAETAGRVRLGFIDAEADYETGVAEAIFPGDSSLTVAQSEVPLALTRSEARATTERWLAEARVAKDSLRFALPPSRSNIGAGDVVTLDGVEYRLDQVEQNGVRLIEAVRVEDATYTASDGVEETAQPRGFTPPVPVTPLFLDLPLLTGDEVPHSPHLAATASPWPGTVAVYTSNDDSDFEQNILLEAPAIMGETETPLFAARPGLWDRGQVLRVRLAGGALSSASAASVLAGKNAAVIGDGSSDNWEVFQFENAMLVGPDTYDLSGFLRGQKGSDGLIPEDWPVGSKFVLLNGAVEQINLPLSARRLERTYRIGPAQRALDDPSFVERREAFSGVGLRPYAPSHLTIKAGANDSFSIHWIRRTRIDGDDWVPMDVPLGEGGESYLLRIVKNGMILREEVLTEAAFDYSASAQAIDGVTRPFRVEVAQLSDSFGPGLFNSTEVPV